MGIDMKAALEFAGQLDDDMNSILTNVYNVENSTDGVTDITTSTTDTDFDDDGKVDTITDADGNAVQAGTYVHIEGMPGGDTFIINGEKVGGMFDLGSAKGALAVGLRQQITDSKTQSLTSTNDLANKINAKLQRSFGST